MNLLIIIVLLVASDIGGYNSGNDAKRTESNLGFSYPLDNFHHGCFWLACGVNPDLGAARVPAKNGTVQRTVATQHYVRYVFVFEVKKPLKLKVRAVILL